MEPPGRAEPRSGDRAEWHGPSARSSLARKGLTVLGIGEGRKIYMCVIMVYVTDLIKKQFRSFGRPRTIIKWSDTGHGNKPPVGENIFRKIFHQNERTGLLRPCVDGAGEFSPSLLLENQYFPSFLFLFIYHCVQTQQILNYMAPTLWGLLARRACESPSPAGPAADLRGPGFL